MRVMAIGKATKETEAGVLPTIQEMEEMGQFNEELVKAGILLAGDGLHASKEGVRIYYDGSKRTIVDGPFTEAKELIAGFSIWEVKSMAEAIEWAKRAPVKNGQCELRRIAEAEDFGDAFTPELREQEDRLRNQLTSQQ
jgi:hypothetical protein